MSHFILPDDLIAKLGRLSVATSSKLRGHHKGSHRSSRIGSSLDFSDYREYALGMTCGKWTGMSMQERKNILLSGFWMNKK